jgi:predicted ribonuclease toxin of YeeF-YezG toxin-antitoxin module
MKLPQDSEHKIRKHFNKLSKKIFLKKDINQIAVDNYHLWDLPKYNTDDFVDSLKET